MMNTIASDVTNSVEKGVLQKAAVTEAAIGAKKGAEVVMNGLRGTTARILDFLEIRYLYTLTSTFNIICINKMFLQIPTSIL